MATDEKSFAEKPFKLVELKSDKTSVRKVYLLLLSSETFLYEKIDEGIGGEINGNIVVIKYAAKQFRLYCYYDGLLTKGPLCSKYMMKGGHFVFADADDCWSTSKHACEGFSVMGKYEGNGLWILKKARSVTVSLFLDGKIKKYSYKSMRSSAISPFEFYVFPRKDEYYDVFITNHNSCLLYAEKVEPEVAEFVLQDRDGMKLLETVNLGCFVDKIIG